MTEQRNWFLSLLQEVGSYQVSQQRKLTLKDVQKKGRLDPVSEVDLESEQRLVSALQDRFPDDGILAEEEHVSEGTSGRRWIVDPLDGTSNFVHKHPFYGISIGLQAGEQLVEGYTYFPRMEKFYEARKGGPALKNGQPISVSPISDPENTLLATGFHDVEVDKSMHNPPIFNEILPRVQGVRRAGSAAHDMCLVAEGVYEGFWEFDLKPWDTAGSAVILREAGGRITDMYGGDDWLNGENVLATNGHLHDRVLEWIAPHMPEEL